MHRIPKNPSQIYSEQSVSGAEETHPSSRNMRRSRSSSTLDSSPLAKRRRGGAGEAQKSNLGGFNKAGFDDADARMANMYKQYGITTGEGSSKDGSNSFFVQEFEATYLSYGQDGVLESGFFPLEMPCDSENQGRLEERGEKQSDSAENSLADLPTAHTDDWLAEEDGEMDLGGEPEANHTMPSSGVWEIRPGQTRMRINRDVLQNFIKATSPDLAMSEGALREAYIEKYEKKSCPGLTAFKEELSKLRAKQVENSPNQPTPWQKRTKVDHNALQSFIKAKSSDLTMSARALREAYIETHEGESYPAIAVFERDLKNLRAEWVRENPGQPKLWPELIKVEHETCQTFIMATSPDLKMSAQQIRDVFINTHREESHPSIRAFEDNLYALRKKQVEENPTLSNPSRPRRKNVMVKPEVRQEFIKAASSDLRMSASKLRDAFMNQHGEESCPSLPVFKRELKKLRK